MMRDRQRSSWAMGRCVMMTCSVRFVAHSPAVMTVVVSGAYEARDVWEEGNDHDEHNVLHFPLIDKQRATVVAKGDSRLVTNNGRR